MPSSSGNGTDAARDDAHDSTAADGSGGGDTAKHARRDAAPGASASGGGGGGGGKVMTPKRPGDDIVRCSVPFGPHRCFALRSGSRQTVTRVVRLHD